MQVIELGRTGGPYSFIVGLWRGSWGGPSFRNLPLCGWALRTESIVVCLQTRFPLRSCLFIFFAPIYRALIAVPSLFGWPTPHFVWLSSWRDGDLVKWEFFFPLWNKMGPERSTWRENCSVKFKQRAAQISSPKTNSAVLQGINLVTKSVMKFDEKFDIFCKLILFINFVEVDFL